MEQSPCTKNELSFLEKIRKKVGKGINTYGLIAANDHVLVALSGGKDSFVLLETLALRRKHLPITYTLSAAHIHLEGVGYEVDAAALASFCAGLDVPFHFIAAPLVIGDAPEKSPCFLCSWNRRKALFGLAARLGCNKLAMGHHMDDMVETLLMNMIYQGSIGTMPPRVSMFDGEIDIIRPLTLVSNRELSYYARIRAFPLQTKECPHGATNKRDLVRRLLAECEKDSRKAKSNIFHAMSNIHEEYLPPQTRRGAVDRGEERRKRR